MAFQAEESKYKRIEKDLRSGTEGTIELTIKQIINLAKNDPDTFLVNKTSLIDRGRLITEVFVIGNIVCINKSESLITLTVNDYTGTILIKLPLYDIKTQKEVVDKLKIVRCNNWYRFFTKLIINKKQVELLLYNVWEIKNKMEICHTGLNIIYQDIYLNLSSEERKQLNNIKKKEHIKLSEKKKQLNDIKKKQYIKDENENNKKINK